MKTNKILFVQGSVLNVPGGRMERARIVSHLIWTVLKLICGLHAESGENGRKVKYL
jgi:hypothetical protein